MLPRIVFLFPLSEYQQPVIIIRRVLEAQQCTAVVYGVVGADRWHWCSCTRLWSHVTQ